MEKNQKKDQDSRKRIKTAEKVINVIKISPNAMEIPGRQTFIVTAKEETNV